MPPTNGSGPDHRGDDGGARKVVLAGKLDGQSSKPTPTKVKSWRDVLPVHPAANLFPLMSPDELRALGEDIKAHGLTSPIVLWSPKRRSGKTFLLDGRNRLDALERLGCQIVGEWGLELEASLGVDYTWPIYGKGGLAESDGFCESGYDGNCDPYAFVISANIHRRHLTAEQKRELIAKLIKATPEKSNRQIAETVKVDHKTVASVRAEKEATGEIPQLTKTVGKDGKARQQPARKARQQPNYEPVDAAQAAAMRDAEERRAEKAAEESRNSLAYWYFAADDDTRNLFMRVNGLRSIDDDRDDIGKDSNGESVRKDARIAELEADKRRLEIENLALKSEVEELKARLATDGDGLGIPGFLRRVAP
jgi:hypothetical protein